MGTDIEPAVPAGEDPRSYAQVLAEVYDATMAGGKSPARPRDLISASWLRLRRGGVDPDAVRPRPIVADLELRRRESGLAPLLPDLIGGLAAATAGGDNIVVVTDSHGKVLWRSGARAVLHRADRLGFVEGADWAEDSAGTNAIGTALVSRTAVQVFSAEHFLRSHHAWTCSGAPIRDPRDGRLLGAIDVSGPANTVAPIVLALVDAVARLAESSLREQHRRQLDGLRSVAAPLLASAHRPALAVDNHGWVAAVGRTVDRGRIAIPTLVQAGTAWLPELGVCDVEPLPGGWLVLPTEDDPGTIGARSRVRLDLRDPHHSGVHVQTELGSWSHELSPRHAEILFLLAVTPGGTSAAELAADIFGDRGRAITVRAEMSRLRKYLVGVLAAQPYRFADEVAVDLVFPADRSRLLPHSLAVTIGRHRSVMADE
ncbi:GAF domain-containing protein [Gordonia rubripertincta]|uniref:GAF domain-containing protein n=1 Tax=Gordonia rubripertincta TaxID=36822 RepID=A0ABT4MTB5_GORRU|nr:GAF domain-containing protein [Gordonia rubripertincta]MCZ4550259.1 GAF domain-containing protein [Gordonia rubripertincta]